MINLMGRVGDRLLAVFAPKATAKADLTFYKFCFCYDGWKYAQRCDQVAGQSYCGPCEFRGTGC
ncbi:hypothetical protein R8Z50_16055 [Longispora sp. K20-0274]|uniref:hypothetical protein n=1 Tax=Longispora sp. K20-0274 TaxID=3088255 RepID=UPI00399AA295